MSLEHMEFDILVVNNQDRSGRLAKAINEAYSPHYTFGELQYTTNLHKAIQLFREEDFHLCFIDSQFEEDDIKAFVKDYNELGKDIPCAFIQVHQIVKGELDRMMPKMLGFHAVISTQGSAADREDIDEALEFWSEEAEIAKRKIDVTSALDLILKEVDKAARDVKRGMFTKFNTIPSEFAALQTEFHNDIADKYFRELNDKTEEAEPENAIRVEIPEDILKRALPGLEKDKYTGVSRRVWQRLLKKHGITQEQAEQMVSKASQAIEETETSPSEMSDTPPADEETTIEEITEEAQTSDQETEASEESNDETSEVTEQPAD
ncbi:MAG: hypothetical protein KDD55_07020 [Bdellovibrionales bacterium]|nr:hypothetical protein [Bdellovibrionales bacterium]